MFSWLAALRGRVRLLSVALRRSDSSPALEPGGEAFPKRVFELLRDDPRTPDGLSAAYLRLSGRLWRERWARTTETPLSASEAWLQTIHAEVLRAHELERELLSELEAKA